MKTKSPKLKIPAEKVDLLKLHKADYVTPSSPVLLEIKPARYLSVEGNGKPGTGVFEARIGALYAMAYTVKMTRKFEDRGDYAVGKLECLYLNLRNEPTPPAEEWTWKLLIRTPEFINEKDLSAALALLKKRGKEGDAALVKLETLKEGRCVQMLHVGPYDKECASVEKMVSFAKTKGFKPAGDHHEIYISDPRRIEPARLKTILRLPVSA